jgi:hypothetical protein
MTNEADTRRELQVVEEYLARCTARMEAIQAERDRLLLRLLDNEGAHDQRFVGVR